MDKQELIQVATDYARQRGWHVENYEVSAVRKAKGKYWLHFQGKSGQVGDHFSVWIDASTGQVIQLLPGR